MTISLPAKLCTGRAGFERKAVRILGCSLCSWALVGLTAPAFEHIKTRRQPTQKADENPVVSVAVGSVGKNGLRNVQVRASETIMADPWRAPSEILILRAKIDDTIIVSSTHAGSR